MRLSLLVILLIFTNSIFAKSEYKKDVDSLLESSNNTFIKLEYIESLKLAREALHISTETNYAKGVTYSQLYIARVLQDVGLKMDALKYLKKIENEKYYHKDAFIQAEIYRIKGRIASSERLYSLEKEYYLKQLGVSKDITDLDKKDLSITMAYFFIQHLYVKQNKIDSVVVYQDLLKEHFSNSKDSIGKYYYISLYADKGLLYKNLGRLDEAAKELDKSIQFIDDDKSSLLFYILQIYGDLEIARGDTVKAVSYYKEALAHSTNLQVNHKTMYLHKKNLRLFETG